MTFGFPRIPVGMGGGSAAGPGNGPWFSGWTGNTSSQRENSQANSNTIPNDNTNNGSDGVRQRRRRNSDDHGSLQPWRRNSYDSLGLERYGSTGSLTQTQNHSQNLGNENGAAAQNGNQLTGQAHPADELPYDDLEDADGLTEGLRICYPDGPDFMTCVRNLFAIQTHGVDIRPRRSDPGPVNPNRSNVVNRNDPEVVIPPTQVEVAAEENRRTVARQNRHRRRHSALRLNVENAYRLPPRENRLPRSPRNAPDSESLEINETASNTNPIGIYRARAALSDSDLTQEENTLPDNSPGNAASRIQRRSAAATLLSVATNGFPESENARSGRHSSVTASVEEFNDRVIENMNTLRELRRLVLVNNYSEAEMQQLQELRGVTITPLLRDYLTDVVRSGRQVDAMVLFQVVVFFDFSFFSSLFRFFDI